MLLKYVLYLNFVFCLVDIPFRTPLALTICWLVHTKSVSTEMICSKILTSISRHSI
jgi:ABC-type protease/lipase transport system fused ATPase/permease subunit